MSVKKLMIKSTLPHFIGLLNTIIELIAENSNVKDWLSNNQPALSMLYCAADWVDWLLGDDEDEIEEMAIDELKEAIVNIAMENGFEPVILWEI